MASPQLTDTASDATRPSIAPGGHRVLILSSQIASLGMSIFQLGGFSKHLDSVVISLEHSEVIKQGV